MSQSKVREYLQENKLLLNKSKNGKAGVKDVIILINHWVHKVILTIAQIAVIIMLCIVFFNVILRYCFNSGIGAVDEVAKLLVTLFTFLACAIGVRDHMHISVTMIYSRFPKDGKMRKFMDVLSDVATLICGIILVYYGMKYLLQIYGRPGNLPMTGLPTWVQYIPAPLGGIVVTFDSLLFLLGIHKPTDLLYSEQEVDYGEILKQQAAEAAAEAAKGGKN